MMEAALQAGGNFVSSIAGKIFGDKAADKQYR